MKLKIFRSTSFCIFSLSDTLSALAIFIFPPPIPNAPKARSYKIKMCSNNAPIVAKIHGQFFFPLFKTTPSKFSAKILPPLQRRGILHVLNFENNRRSLRSRQKTFTKPFAPTELNLKTHNFSTNLLFLRNNSLKTIFRIKLFSPKFKFYPIFSNFIL